MNKFWALILALVSGVFLAFDIAIPDPIPFIDEGVALAVLLKCTMFLGYDLRKWLPFFGKSARCSS